MTSPVPFAILQGFAHRVRCLSVPFARPSTPGACFEAGQILGLFGLHKRISCRSPFLRSGPPQAGPSPSRQDDATGTRWFESLLEIPAATIDSVAITTNQRGSSRRRSFLSSSPCFQDCLPAESRTRQCAGLPVPLQARWSPMRWTKPCWQMRPLAVSPDLPPAGSNWACLPAAPATDLTACWRMKPNHWTARADRLDRPFILRA